MITLEEAWAQLERHLDWAEGFWIAFVLGAEEQVHQLQARTRLVLAQRGARDRVLRPSTPQELREVLPELLGGEPTACTWLEAVREEAAQDPPGPWTEAWDWVALRTNERREQLRARSGGLVLAAAPGMKGRFREAAPDLWSIRSLVLELAPEAAPTGDERARRTNAWRIAEGVLRVGFHLHMQRAWWWGLVVGDDAAPRRRLQDALAEDGRTVLVHAGFSAPSLRRASEVDLYWVPVDDDPPVALLEMLSGAAPPPSRPLLVEGSLELEQHLATRLPDLYGRVAFVVRLHVERHVYPGPLPSLDRVEESVRDAWDALDRARSLEHDLPSLDRASRDEARRDRLQELQRAAEALLVQGWSSEAGEVAEELLEVAEDLHARHPAEPELARARADAEELLGRVARDLGDLPHARERYGRALPIRERLARGRPRGAHQRRSELARCRSVLGELALAAGDHDEARRELTAARELRRRLVRRSDDAETLSELALSWSLLGDLALARHSGGSDGAALAEAQEAFREALGIRRRLAEETGAARHRRYLSIAWGRLGRALARAGDWRQARRAWAEASSLARALADEDPGNVARQMEASVASAQLADAARELGDLDAADAACHEAVRLREQLVREDPDNVRWRHLLAVALGRLADVRLAREGPEAALQTIRRAASLSEQLVWSDPAQTVFWQGLVTARLRQGDAEAALGDAEAARASWSRAAEAARDLAVQGGESGQRRAREALALLRDRDTPKPALEALGRALAEGAVP